MSRKSRERAKMMLKANEETLCTDCVYNQYNSCTLRLPAYPLAEACRAYKESLIALPKQKIKPVWKVEERLVSSEDKTKMLFYSYLPKV